MIRWSTVWGIASADARLNRRLARYWIFLILAAGFWVLSYVGIAFLFYFQSSKSATVAALNPRYLMAAIGVRYAMVMLVGTVFLAFDVRARDANDRIAEVLDSLPYSNLELVFGRCLGMMRSIWLPAAIISLVLYVAGWLVGMPIEPLSLLSWLTLQLIPSLAFVIGLTFLITLLTRNRAVAAVVLLIAVGGLFAATVLVPIWAAPAADFIGAFMAGFPSDLLPTLLTPDGYPQRAGVLAVAIGLLVLAAAVHPRKDDGSVGRRTSAGLALIAVGAAALGFVAWQRHAYLDRVEALRAFHAAVPSAPAPDVRSIAGEVDLEPGRRMAIDVEMTVVAPRDASLDVLRFSFNPGLAIDALESGGTPAPYTHEQGLLTVDRSLAAGEETTLRLKATGRPDPDFAYLDAELNPLKVKAWEGQIFLLGLEPGVFDSNFVALMPAIRWLPTSGPAVTATEDDRRPVDFRTIDLRVRVPEDWTAVVAGRREVEGDVQVFRPEVPVPPVPLIAARFERRATEIDGVVAEVLLHRSHADQYEIFEDAAGEIHTWLEEKLQDAADVGLPYPLDAVSLVEVPQALRGFGGGWRMPSVLGLPGTVLVKETGFPTAALDTPFDDPEDFEDREGGIARAKLETLQDFFEYDFIGGNPFVGASHSFFRHQTSGEGPEGMPLDYVFDELTSRLVVDGHDFFSVYVLDSGMGDVIGQTLQAYFRDRSRIDVVDAVIRTVASRPSVWDRLLQVSLADLDPTDDPEQAVNVLALKGGAMAESMIDELGRENTGRFLAALLARTRGGAYTREDVLAAGREVGVDLEPWLEVWLEQTALPGFKVPETEAYRLEDAADGSPRYQTLVTLANEESVPGLAKVLVNTGGSDDDRWVVQGPVRVEARSAMEVGLVSSKTPKSIRVEPYLSLNRGPFEGGVEGVEEETIRNEEPFRGARPAAWTPPSSDRITIDDLDAGFEVEKSDDEGGFRLGVRRRDDVEMDGGIPVHGTGRVGKRFVRLEASSAWGQYRHTVAAARCGPDGEAATFRTEIGRAGPWRLELYVPPAEDGGTLFSRSTGIWTVEIVDPSGRNETEIDAATVAGGWCDLGTFEIAPGEVVVRLRGKDDDTLVLADAVRWTPPAETTSSATGASR